MLQEPKGSSLHSQRPATSNNNNNSIIFHQSKKIPLAKDMKHVNEIKHDYNNQLVNTYNQVPLLHSNQSL
jgi:hypothetical protein